LLRDSGKAVRLPAVTEQDGQGHRLCVLIMANAPRFANELDERIIDPQLVQQDRHEPRIPLHVGSLRDEMPKGAGPKHSIPIMDHQALF